MCDIVKVPTDSLHPNGFNADIRGISETQQQQERISHSQQMRPSAGRKAQINHSAASEQPCRLGRPDSVCIEGRTHC